VLLLFLLVLFVGQLISLNYSYRSQRAFFSLFNNTCARCLVIKVIIQTAVRARALDTNIYNASGCSLNETTCLLIASKPLKNFCDFGVRFEEIIRCGQKHFGKLYIGIKTLFMTLSDLVIHMPVCVVVRRSVEFYKIQELSARLVIVRCCWLAGSRIDTQVKSKQIETNRIYGLELWSYGVI
jgi:hypothetical protein